MRTPVAGFLKQCHQWRPPSTDSYSPASALVSASAPLPSPTLGSAVLLPRMASSTSADVSCPFAVLEASIALGTTAACERSSPSATPEASAPRLLGTAAGCELSGLSAPSVPTAPGKPARPGLSCTAAVPEALAPAAASSLPTSAPAPRRPPSGRCRAGAGPPVGGSTARGGAGASDGYSEAAGDASSDTEVRYATGADSGISRCAARASHTASAASRGRAWGLMPSELADSRCFGPSESRLLSTSSPSRRPMNSHLWITAAKLQGVPQAFARALSALVIVSSASTCATPVPAQSSPTEAPGGATRSEGRGRTPTSSSRGTSIGHFTSSRLLKTTTASAPALAAARAAASARVDWSAAWKALAQRRSERKAEESMTDCSPRSRMPKQICDSRGSSGASTAGASWSMSASSPTRLRREVGAEAGRELAAVRLCSPVGPWVWRLSTARISGRE
mmetsp:Transcript_113887/g.332779  ORF Transcript_113887/g.332779 Transcript_113887/m.332779 type:complete len:451 (-) Transcript_113887:1487-2839(-)